MSTHVIMDAVKAAGPLLEQFRVSQVRLLLHLGDYIVNEDFSYYFMPGVSNWYFRYLIWFLGTCTSWSKIEDWKQILESFWTDRSLLRRIHDQKQHKKEEEDKQDASYDLAGLPIFEPQIQPVLPQYEPVNYIKGILRGNGDQIHDMDYEESLGPEKKIDLFCPERTYSLQMKTQNNRPLNSEIAAPVHLVPVSYYSIKRTKSFYYQDIWAYHFTVARTGRLTKHDTVAFGQTSFHVSIEMFRDQHLLDSKNNIPLAGDLLEKGIDLLLRHAPYSLEVLKPLSSNCREIFAKRLPELQEEPELNPATTVDEKRTPRLSLEYIPYVY